MTPTWTSERVRLYCGDCLRVLPRFGACSVDTVITDPPYGLEFMGKDWDHGVPGVAYWQEVLRVAKPGAMLLAFGGTRTHHRLMCAIEDAGWELRDVISWIYGSGFPKSHDISKAIDKSKGAEREVVGFDEHKAERFRRGLESQNGGWDRPWMHEPDAIEKRGSITAPSTPLAQLWDGWGTALKPAWEPVIVAMKPRDGTFAHNAEKWGVAGMWIEGGRVGVTGGETHAKSAQAAKGHGIYGKWGEVKTDLAPRGRWPANLIHDGSDEAVGGMPETGNGNGPRITHHNENNGTVAKGKQYAHETMSYGATGSAARFFYCAKASRSERTCGGTVDNDHPTVKPLALMRYLCKLTKTPTGGIVLDPFAGSGSTGCAAVLEGREFVGIELGAHNVEIARQRIEAAQREIVQGEFL